MVGILWGIIAVLSITSGILFKLYINSKDTVTAEKLGNRLLRRDNAILREQRDNNIATVDDADRVWADKNN